MADAIYISIMDEKESREIKKFIRQFSKFHNKKRHSKEKTELHEMKVIEDQDGFYLVISSAHHVEGHMVKTMADVLAFLEENPEFEDIDIWGDKLEITGRLV